MAARGGPPSYSLRSVQNLLGLSRRVVTGLIDAGFVSPGRGPRNEYVFSFRDTVLLRTAHRLQAARMSPRKILRSLASLRRQLPAELPLSGLRITAVGNDIAVRDGGAPWAAESGQLLLDFEVAPDASSVAFLERLDDDRGDAANWFARAVEHESRHDNAAAEAAYRRALELDPAYIDAWLNLGALLCEQGRSADSVALYDTATARAPDAPLLHFNRGVALEDGKRWHEALASYERCLQLDPSAADAHFNAARLHEQLGHAKDALRHFSAYRRLARGGG